MLILTQFVLRLSFGLALAMGLTSPRKVTSGYFRNHSYVLLGLNVLALLGVLAMRNSLDFNPWLLLTGAILSYLCAAVWLYEKHRAGQFLLLLVAGVSLAAAWFVPAVPATASSERSTVSTEITVQSQPYQETISNRILWRTDVATSGLLLGATIAAMFLGHWYLNTPTMELAPLRKLIGLMAIAVIAQGVVSGLGLALQLQAAGSFAATQTALVALRWLAGIVSTAILTWMAWQTLKIPNTQSATGILYVAVITTFIGELASLLLSQSTGFPL
jgi:hypothetical protein